MVHLMNWAFNHWYDFFWLWIFGVFSGVRDFFVVIFMAIAETFKAVSGSKHRRRVEELKLQLKVEKARAAGAALPAPGGPCTHPPSRLVPIIAAGESQPTAWLCRGCDTQLDADVAVRKEDLP